MIGKGADPQRRPRRRDGRGHRRPRRDRARSTSTASCRTRRRTATRTARTRPATSCAASATTPATSRRRGAFPTPSTYPQVDPLNFSDIGYDLPAPEVHADGEIWIAVNFDIRQALGGEVQRASSRSPTRRCSPAAPTAPSPVNQCPGNRRWIQLLYDSFLLDPTNPTMVDARDAMLAADQMRFGGAEPERAVAARSRGAASVDFASSTNGTGRTIGVESDTNPLPDFEVAGPEQRGDDVRRGRRQASRAGGAGADLRRPLRGARLAGRRHRSGDERAGDGEHEQPRSDGDVRAGHVRVRRDRARLRRRALPADVPRRARPDDHAAHGAQLGVEGPGRDRLRRRGAVPHDTATRVVQPAAQVNSNLIDDTENTNWQAAATQQGTAWTVDGKQATVDLAGEPACGSAGCR